MRYQQFANENQGLSYFDEEKATVGGLGELSLGNMVSNLPFKGVATAIYGDLLSSSKLNAWQKVNISVPGSYVPDMLRKYMNMVRVNRKAYSPSAYESYWLPAFVDAGFDPNITKAFFDKFYSLYRQGAVLQSIWYPDASSKGDNGGSGNGGTGNGGGMSTGTMLAIGLGVVGAGVGLWLALK